MRGKIDYSRVRKILKIIESNEFSGDNAEEILQKASVLIYEEFKEFLVLARFFLSVSFNDLPGADKEWTETFIEKVGDKCKIDPRTPVLSLFGSSGKEEQWTERLNSKNHAGIPLLSSEFVDKFPMMSWVLVEQGISVKELLEAKGVLPLADFDNSQGIIYVSDAKTEIDNQGRKIIFAEDFVKEYDIKTVFGFGGRIAFTNNFLTGIFFSNEHINLSSK